MWSGGSSLSRLLACRWLLLWPCLLDSPRLGWWLAWRYQISNVNFTLLAFWWDLNDRFWVCQWTKRDTSFAMNGMQKATARHLQSFIDIDATIFFNELFSIGIVAKQLTEWIQASLDLSIDLCSVNLSWSRQSFNSFAVLHDFHLILAVLFYKLCNVSFFLWSLTRWFIFSLRALYRTMLFWLRLWALAFTYSD